MTTRAKSKLKSFVVGSVFLSLLVATPFRATADQNLIRELDKLRNSLPYKDSSRPSLTLRLADVVYDEVTRLNSISPDPSPAEYNKITSLRKKALKLYQEALTGANGLFSRPSGVQRTKIQFQMARLYSDLGELSQANQLFEELVKQNEIVSIQRESALRLAETAENKKSHALLPVAKKYYDLAISLCEGGDVCSYVHYRKAWLLYNQQELPAALAEMKMALYDSKNQVREEALRDYLVFLSNVPGDGRDQLMEIEELGTKLNRPELLEQLGDGFYAVGNKVAGTNVLTHVNQKSPQLKKQVRLLEEFYGLRRWDEFRAVLDQLSTVTAAALPQDKSEQNFVEKYLRRVSIQLDGERETKKEHIPDFHAVVSLYMNLFPNTELRSKMIDGWLVAEPSEENKLAQLKTWIAEEKAAGRTKEEIRLRKMRTSVAQKLKLFDVVIEESAALATLEKSESQQRKYRYIQARSLYEIKKYDEALPVFKSLADPNSFKSADEWATQSQNLALDIYAQRKDYASALALSSLWLNSPKISKDPALKKELADMQRISLETTFEQATALGESPKALATFQQFCLEKKFYPKSCENAKYLAVKLQDQTALLTVLENENQVDDLMSEYEAAAYFVKAATLVEKKNSPLKSDYQSALKLALLYELGNDLTNRDRVLDIVWKRVSKEKSLDDKLEPLLKLTFQDAGMLSSVKVLSLPWSKTNREYFAHDLEASGIKTKETQNILLSSKTYLGPAWSQRVLDVVNDLDVQQRKYSFYGRASKKKFETRLKKISTLKAKVEEYLEGSDTQTRVRLLAVLTHAYKDLSQEVLNTPLPKGLDEETAAGLQKALTDLAAPFVEQGASYEKLAREQAAKETAPEVKVALEQLITSREALQSDKIVMPQGAAPKYAKKIDLTSVQGSLDVLHKKPTATEAMQKLKDFYDSLGLKRLSAYYQGRMLNIKEGKSS